MAEMVATNLNSDRTNLDLKVRPNRTQKIHAESHNIVAFKINFTKRLWFVIQTLEERQTLQKKLSIRGPGPILEHGRVW